MAQLLVGRCDFEDATYPAVGKSEWGMDTLTRKMKGHVYNLEAYMATIAQGDTIDFNGATFYLQSWQADDASPTATVTLNYKGLIAGGTPPVDIQREVVLTKGQTTQSYSTENDGLGRVYRTIPLWTFDYTAGSPPPLGGIDSVIATRAVHAVSATMEFTYRTVEARYRYIAVGAPVAARFFLVGISYTLIIDDARIIMSDGAILGREYEVILGLTPTPQQNVISFASKNVIGSPYWECEDRVRLELVSAT